MRRADARRFGGRPEAGTGKYGARANLAEALTLFFETADASEVQRRYRGEVLVTQVEVSVG